MYYNGYRIQEVIYQGTKYPLGFKVVTMDLKSLGLKNNPNIIQYTIGEWVSLDPCEITEDDSDYGGMWVARTLSGAKELKKYMKTYHNKETRIFKSCLGKILFANKYRVKTDKILIFEEII